MFNVPFYVYILFCVILYIGIKRCRTSVMRVERLALLPVIFGIFTMKSVSTLFNMDMMGISYLFFGILVGIVLGYTQVKNRIIHADKNNGLIKIPGDFSMLVLLLSIFFIEFFIHYAVDAHLIMADSVFFKCVAIIVSGVVMGISLGRNITYYFKYLDTSFESPMIAS
jgi:hypothetical protein